MPGITTRWFNSIVLRQRFTASVAQMDRAASLYLALLRVRVPPEARLPRNEPTHEYIALRSRGNQSAPAKLRHNNTADMISAAEAGQEFHVTRSRVPDTGCA